LHLEANVRRRIRGEQRNVAGGLGDRERHSRRAVEERAERKIAALVLAVFAALQAGAQPAGAASSPQMHFDKYMTVQSVCFTVTNPELGQSTLYGQRFTDGGLSPQTPAIVLAKLVKKLKAQRPAPSW